MLTGPGSVSTVTTDELRAQNIHRTLDESLNEDFVFTREKFRFPGLLLGKKEKTYFSQITTRSEKMTSDHCETPLACIVSELFKSYFT